MQSNKVYGLFYVLFGLVSIILEIFLLKQAPYFNSMLYSVQFAFFPICIVVGMYILFLHYILAGFKLLFYTKAESTQNEQSITLSAKRKEFSKWAIIINSALFLTILAGYGILYLLVDNSGWGNLLFLFMICPLFIIAFIIVTSVIKFYSTPPELRLKKFFPLLIFIFVVLVVLNLSPSWFN